MRKMVFSAIALTAFSFAGMASEIEERKVEVKTTEINYNKEIVKTNCVEVANALMILHPEAWFDPFTFVGTWAIIYSNCKASNQ
jgi:hypothetical protein